MKILVIDDKLVNREAARQTIVGHELTVVDGWDAAMEVMEVTYDKEAIKAKLVAAGMAPDFDSLRASFGNPKTAEEDKLWEDWWKSYYKFENESRLPYWDIVLTDLMMPASSETMGREGMRFVGQEMPIGLAIVLLAAQNGAKYVAVVTAADHHSHPAVAMLDRVLSREGKPALTINGAQVMIGAHDAHPVDGTICAKCKATSPEMAKCWTCDKTGKVLGKHWGKVMAQLLGEEVEDD